MNYDDSVLKAHPTCLSRPTARNSAFCLTAPLVLGRFSKQFEMEALSARVSNYLGRDDATATPVTDNTQIDGHVPSKEGDIEGPSILNELRRLKAELQITAKNVGSANPQDESMKHNVREYSTSIEEAMLKLQPLLYAASPVTLSSPHAAS